MAVGERVSDSPKRVRVSGVPPIYNPNKVGSIVLRFVSHDVTLQ